MVRFCSQTHFQTEKLLKSGDLFTFQSLISFTDAYVHYLYTVCCCITLAPKQRRVKTCGYEPRTRTVESGTVHQWPLLESD